MSPHLHVIHTLYRLYVAAIPTVAAAELDLFVRLLMVQFAFTSSPVTGTSATRGNSVFIPVVLHREITMYFVSISYQWRRKIKVQEQLVG